MNSLDKFRTRIDAKQTELILRKLVKKQEDGEIRNDDELRTALADMLKEVANAGFITLEIPVKPWEKIESERFKSFFDSLGMDIETLFVEVDHTEDVLSGLTQNVTTQLRNLQFALGNLRSEVISRRLRRTPGSGWSTILRDSFDSGYGKLLGRAELSVDLFYDDRTGYSQDNENVPIKSDARIEGIAKKLTLPETGNDIIGFKRAQLLWESGTTQSNIPVDNIIDTHRMIDGQTDTFWSFIIGSEYPFLGTPESDTVQIAGTELSGNTFSLNLSGLKDSQAHEYYVRIVGFSGTIPQYACLASPEDYSGPTCSFDLGNRCQWNYTNQYSTNCANRNCSRYSPELPMLSGTTGFLDDGYGYDTGAIINFNNLSGIYAGQTWRIGIKPSSSGIQGAQICLELTLTKSTKINWIEIDPVTAFPFSLVAVEFTRQGNTTRQDIVSSSVQVIDRIRLDFAAIEADKVYLTLRQETYEKADLHLRPEQQAIKKIDSFMTRVNAPSIEEFYNVELESLLVNYLPNGPLRRAVDQMSVKPQEVKGNFYNFGLFEVNCGLTSYADTAIAVAKDQRVITPRMFGVQSNLEPDITYASGFQSGQNGTVEFSAVKFNYDKNNILINIDDFPVPLLSASGTITERFFVDSDNKGYLRFAAKAISQIFIVNENDSTSDYTLDSLNTPVLKSQVTITDPVVTEDSILLVTYTPQFGVFLNEGRTLSIEDNSNMTLSISEVPALIVAAAKTSNRDIKFADVYLRVILRRNDLDIYGSPGLRDYQFLVSEADEGRFF